MTCSGGISEKKWHPHIVEEDAQCGKTRNLLTEKIFRENNSLVVSLFRPLLSRNFWQKCVRVKFRNFHTV